MDEKNMKKCPKKGNFRKQVTTDKIAVEANVCLRVPWPVTHYFGGNGCILLLATA